MKIIEILIDKENLSAWRHLLSLESKLEIKTATSKMGSDKVTLEINCKH